jgi:hypothetical protein
MSFAHLCGTSIVPVGRALSGGRCSRQHSLQHMVFQNEAMEQRRADMQTDQREKYPCEDAVHIAHCVAERRTWSTQ